MPTLQELIDEKTALDNKRQALGTFIESAAFDALPEAERERISRQAIAMTAYSDVLGERIGAF